MDHVETIRREGATLADAAEAAGLDAPVPACPGWDVRRLVRHIAKVLQRTEHVVRTGAQEPPPAGEFPPFDDDYRLFAQFRGTVDALCLTLEIAEPHGSSWNFSGRDLTNAFWSRRMTHEITVHRMDAQRAAAVELDPVPAEQAVDGVDELLAVLVPMKVMMAPPSWSGTIHLHATDAEGEWMVAVADGAVDVAHAHGKGDLAVRGPATGLFTWAWNRSSPAEAGLECFGDDALLEAWPTLVP